MSQYQESSNKGYVATSAIIDGAAVKLSSSQVVVATAGTDAIIGVTVGAVAAGETGTVRLRSASGTTKAKLGVGGATVGQPLTAGAGGLLIVTSTAGHQIVGYALEAGSANDYIEIMPSTGKF